MIAKQLSPLRAQGLEVQLADGGGLNERLP